MKYSFPIAVLILIIIVSTVSVYGQQTKITGHYFEIHYGYQSSFGPTENHAEIAGGVDSLYFDNKKHLIAGFKSGSVAEIALGFHKKLSQFQSTISYYQKDIGLVQSFSSNEYAFVIADMLSVRLSAMLHITNKETPTPYGLFTGIFFGTDFPVSYKLNNQTANTFEIKDFKPAVQFCWGIDIQYSLRLSKKGWYTKVGLSTTMPGLVGEIGKIELRPQSSYTLVQDNIKMYSLGGFVGIGINIGKKQTKQTS